MLMMMNKGDGDDIQNVSRSRKGELDKPVNLALVLSTSIQNWVNRISTWVKLLMTTERGDVDQI